MTGTLSVSNVRFTPAPELDRQAGLLGWISCHVDGFDVDGLALRISNAGVRHIAWPARRSICGRKHAVVRPIHSALADAIQEKILAAMEARP